MKKIITLISALFLLCGSIFGGNTDKQKVEDNSPVSSTCEQENTPSGNSKVCEDIPCDTENTESKDKKTDDLKNAEAEKEEIMNDNTATVHTDNSDKNSNHSDTEKQNTSSGINTDNPSCNPADNSSCKNRESFDANVFIEEILKNYRKNNNTQIQDNTESSADTEPAVTNDEKTEVFEIVNRERLANGLGALVYRNDLQAAADKRAEEIVSNFSHTRPNGASCFTVLSEYGISYRAVGENIAYGQRTPEAVMSSWMNSSGHRANILNQNFTGVAIGLKTIGNTKYWVQIFIK